MEIQLAEDVTEEGLLALAGRSAQQFDQGQHKHWENALYLQKDFGASRDWYVKDSLMFTSTCTTKRCLPHKQCDKLIPTFPTHFGCTKLQKFRLVGNKYVFPPLAIRSKITKLLSAPVLELGFYILLLHLKQLRRFNLICTPLMIVRLAGLLPSHQRASLRLNLKELLLSRQEQLEVTELSDLAEVCADGVRELKDLDASVLSEKVRSTGDRQLVDGTICDFLKKFTCLHRLTCKMKLSCLNSFMAAAGQQLTFLNINSQISASTDLIVLRR